VLLEMINDILDLAKIEAGKMEVRPSEFRIDSIVCAQCDMVRSLTEEKNIDLDVEGRARRCRRCFRIRARCSRS
jgi:two-component system, NarL family, sensor histidine kinase BarA